MARGGGRSSAHALLPERFQEAVDAAGDGRRADRLGRLHGADGAWTGAPCGDDLDAEAAAVAAALEAEWTDEVLTATIRAGGIKGGEDVAGGARPCAFAEEA